MLSSTLLRRSLLSTRRVNRTYSKSVTTYINKVLDNPLPLGVGALVVGLLQLRRIRERGNEEVFVDRSEENGEDWQVTCYRSLPLRHVSRVWGFVNDIYLPLPIRRWVLGSYINTFGCDMSEAEETELENYENLGQLFRRRLRSEARPLDESSCMVSPCDGKLLHLGQVEPGDKVEQVKGVSYSLNTFLGSGKQSEVRPVDCMARSLEARDGGKKLYQCVLYLAPGDYHCFHSPVDWVVETRRHFPGELLSVSPRVVSVVPGLFGMNERVVYLGSWEHGFFSMTAVGATNVGSVKVGCDPTLCTNTPKWEKETFHQLEFQDGVKVSKGEYFGEFNLGSTIVLLFEAPDDFEFSLGESGSKVRVGRSIAKLDDKIKVDHKAIDTLEAQEDCSLDMSKISNIVELNTNEVEESL